MSNHPIYQTGIHKGGLIALVAFSSVLTLMSAAFLASPMLIIGNLLHARFVTAYWPMLIPAFLLLILMVLSWIQAIIYYRTSLVVVDGDGLQFRTGFFTKREGHLFWREIESVQSRQDWLGQILGYGTVIVVGQGGTPFVLALIPNHQQLANILLGKKPTVQNQTTVRSKRETPTIQKVAEDKTTGPLCGGCGKAVTEHDVEISRYKSAVFANQILCPKCRSYAPS